MITPVHHGPQPECSALSCKAHRIWPHERIRARVIEQLPFRASRGTGFPTDVCKYVWMQSGEWTRADLSWLSFKTRTRQEAACPVYAPPARHLDTSLLQRSICSRFCCPSPDIQSGHRTSESLCYLQWHLASDCSDRPHQPSLPTVSTVPLGPLGYFKKPVSDALALTCIALKRWK